MKIKALVMDVDGTLTDGGIYMGENGEVMKRFDVKDGYAIHNMLPEMGIIPIIITGRTSKIVENRCRELEIKKFIQGSKDKVSELLKVIEVFNIKLEETAYIGDDLNDFEVMQIVGVRGCPANAVKEVRNICEFVSIQNGGNGAVREFVEWILCREEIK